MVTGRPKGRLVNLLGNEMLGNGVWVTSIVVLMAVKYKSTRL
jgi:hypothetical protein